MGLDLGGSVHDRTDPIGRLLFTVLPMIAEFGSDLARARTRERMAKAKAKGQLRGNPPELKPSREAQLVALWRVGGHTTLELAEMFDVGRSTVYRALQRAGPAPAGASIVAASRSQGPAKPGPAASGG